jgi:hypothetical protein
MLRKLAVLISLLMGLVALAPAASAAPGYVYTSVTVDKITAAAATYTLPDGTLAEGHVTGCGEAWDYTDDAWVDVRFASGTSPVRLDIPNGYCITQSFGTRRMSEIQACWLYTYLGQQHTRCSAWTTVRY